MEATELDRDKIATKRLGVVDCDIHPAFENPQELGKYLPQRWRDHIRDYALHTPNPFLGAMTYPRMTPGNGMRRDSWPPSGKPPASDLGFLCEQLLDQCNIDHGVLQPLAAGAVTNNQDLGAALCVGINDWQIDKFAGPEPRLRASIIVPPQNPDYAAAEIDRLAEDKRFVQVMLLVMDEMPLGRRRYWPIYRAAERHGLPVGIHAGSSYRHAVTTVGWPTYYSEDSAAQAQAFQSALTSLMTEGVFAEFPDLKVVLLESGFAWLPAHLWRLGKFWRGLRMEIPWVDRHPLEIAKDHIRLTIQPRDLPEDPAVFERLMNHFDSDEMLLFSTDYPHWQFDGDDALPAGISPALAEKICRDNPLAAYPRLKEAVA